MENDMNAELRPTTCPNIWLFFKSNKCRLIRIFIKMGKNMPTEKNFELKYSENEKLVSFATSIARGPTINLLEEKT